MAIDRAKTRWNGWGWVKAHNPVEGRDAVWPWIANAFGVPDLPVTPAKKLEEISFRPSALDAPARAALVAIVGQANVRDTAYERASHARGKSYHDLLHLRAGRLDDAPDAVVYPRSGDETVRVLQWAEANKAAVIPFAGGSSVVGGVTGA